MEKSEKEDREVWIHLMRVGQYDQAEDIRIMSDGRYEVEDGTYVSRGVRRGRLGKAARRSLSEALAQLPADPAPPIPPSAEGFHGQLSIWDETGTRTITFWGPVPDLPGPLRHVLTLVRGVG